MSDDGSNPAAQQAQRAAPAETSETQNTDVLKPWYRDKQNVALVTGFVSTALTILNLLLGTLGAI